jgi:molybdopterin-guanine dinucleotide biosynthesis protein A
MLGVILCGGKSSRMGDDKGLLLFKSETWAQLAYEKVCLFNLKTVLSINSDQFQDYSSIFLKKQLIPDNTGLNIAGPLLGVVSVHCRFPEEDLLVLACDLPKMKSVVLKELLSQYKKNDGYEAIAFKFGKQTEPLCSIYAAKGLAKILALHNNKSLIKYSMVHVLETLQTKYIVPQESWNSFFRNMNSFSDLIDLNDK